MLPLFLLITLEIVGLWVLSQRLTKSIFTTFLLLFRHRSIAVSAITLILFPGTVIHELSHLFTAEIVGVRTGKLTLEPELTDEEEDIRSGSVQLSQTDPFRRSVIGIAPFVIGLTALIGLSWVLPTVWNDMLIAFQNNILFSSPSLYLLSLISYLLFAVSNTMFSSPEDMKGVVPLAIVIGILLSGTYVAGIRVGITEELSQTIIGVLGTIAQSLVMVLILNAFLLLLSTLFIRLVWRGKARIR